MINSSDEPVHLEIGTKSGHMEAECPKVWKISEEKLENILSNDKWDKTPETGHPFPSPRVLPKMEDFQMGKTLSQEQKDKFYQILLRNYQGCYRYFFLVKRYVTSYFS